MNPNNLLKINNNNENISNFPKESNAIINYTKEKNNNKKKKNSIIGLFISILFFLLILTIIIFFIYNSLNTNITHNISIFKVNISNKNPSDARYIIDEHIENSIPEELILKLDEFESTLSTKQLDISFDTKKSVEQAYSIGRYSNLLENNFNILLSFFNKQDFTPSLTIDEITLEKHLDSLNTQLPNTVIQSSYYIEGNELIITSGSSGNIIDTKKTIENIKNNLLNLSQPNNIVEISTKIGNPEKINVDKIHSEIYKTPVDAYYSTEPFAVFPSENGIDFNISIDEAKALIDSNQKEEYIIPLKTIPANITTNMIGQEAFPDLLGSHSSTYNTYDKDRTTNVILSSNKINTIVLMPGEIFSYNKTVGERTIAAGYKEASVYVNGKTVDGLGGGICQTVTNLYNAVLYSNLEIIERTNHQFIPPYSSASRDATVVYGLLDFKFKNTRDYPIKISSLVSGGTSTVQIYGLKQENEYTVQIKSYQTGSSTTSIYSEAHRILSLNGQIVSDQLLSKDKYLK